MHWKLGKVSNVQELRQTLLKDVTDLLYVWFRCGEIEWYIHFKIKKYSGIGWQTGSILVKRKQQKVFKLTYREETTEKK